MRRFAGLILILLPLLPLHALLRHPRTGLAGAATANMMDAYANVTWAGLMLVAIAAVIAALLTVDIAASAGRVINRIADVPLPYFAGVLAVAATVLSAAFSFAVLDGWPAHIDSVAQFLHARFVADGSLSAPATFADFWIVQNTLVTERGWLSQYPPAHVLLLAAFTAAGSAIGIANAAAALGPMLAGVVAGVSALLTHRLWPHDRALARTAAVLCALSPFVLFLAGSWMNHITAAAFITCGAWTLVRSTQDGRAAWAVAAGAMFSVALATRPVAALAAALALALTIPRLVSRPVFAGASLRVLAFATAGALPVTIVLLAWNAHFFGSPVTFGYDVALGPGAGLGFGTDPWGNTYGVREAVAWTGAELAALGVHLFEAPLPAVPVIGVFLLLARPLDAGTRVVVAWALVPLLAGMLYWHHGLYMGPRMLLEAAPPWIMLFTAAAFGIVRTLPRTLRSSPRLQPRNAFAGAAIVSIGVGLLLLSPQRAASYRIERIQLDATSFPDGSLVFVHGGWSARVAARLAATGMRADIIETLLRQNSTCSLEHLATAVRSGDDTARQRVLANVDTVPRQAAPTSVRQLGPGSTANVVAGERWSAECSREARSDRYGVIDPAAFVWRGQVPAGAGERHGRGTMFVRDLGPARNAELISELSDRTPLLLALDSAGRVAALPYARGVNILWERMP